MAAALPSEATTAAAMVERARAERRWSDASEELSRWLSLCRAERDAAGFRSRASGPASAHGVRLSPRTSFDLEAAAPRVMERLARERLARGKGGKAGSAERLLHLCPVAKKNGRGKVQQRLLALTTGALYNLSADGSKVKRRIDLSALGSVSLHESSGEFVLHVPSERRFERRERGLRPSPPLHSPSLHADRPSPPFAPPPGEYDYHLAATRQGAHTAPTAAPGGAASAGLPHHAGLQARRQRGPLHHSREIPSLETSPSPLPVLAPLHHTLAMLLDHTLPTHTLWTPHALTRPPRILGRRRPPSSARGGGLGGRGRRAAGRGGRRCRRRRALTLVCYACLGHNLGSSPALPARSFFGHPSPPRLSAPAPPLLRVVPPPLL